jgi:D-3-phosphoglycerate dehydrogenase
MPTEVIKTSYPKEKINILLLENISSKAVQAFKNAGYTSIQTFSGAMPEQELIKAIKQVHILGIRSKTKITPSVLAAATKLQSVGCFCIGTNQVHLEEANQLGVAVFNAPYSNTRSVAEMVIGASIMLIRKIPDKNKAAHEGIWRKEAGGSHELRGKTLGIIGYGNIGSQVSVLAEALGMKVLFYDVETKLPLGNATDSKSLKNLLQNSDIVTIHIPGSVQSVHVINKQTIKWMKKEAILINYARGEVVEPAALKNALLSGQIAGAAIDVFPEEPEKNGDTFTYPLQGLSNVLLTPHIGGSTMEAQENIGIDVSTKLINYLEKGVSNGSCSIPSLSLPPSEHTHRILHIHQNMPGVLGEINSLLSKNKINVVGQYLKTNEHIGYVVLDIEKKFSKNAVSLLKKAKGTIKVRAVY